MNFLFILYLLTCQISSKKKKFVKELELLTNSWEKVPDCEFDLHVL